MEVDLGGDCNWRFLKKNFFYTVGPCWLSILNIAVCT